MNTRPTTGQECMMERHVYEGPPCPACGAKHPFDNVFCSNGFHAPPEARPTADLGEDGELVDRLRNARDMLGGHLMPDPANAVSAGIDRLILYREALERIAKYDVGLQALIEDGKDTPRNKAKYYATQVERRRKIARDVLSRSA